MTTNPHEAITKMTSEEYHDFMHGARQQQQREEDHFTAAHTERNESTITVRKYRHGSIILTAHHSSGRVTVESRGTPAMTVREFLEFADLLKFTAEVPQQADADADPEGDA